MNRIYLIILLSSIISTVSYAAEFSERIAKPKFNLDKNSMVDFKDGFGKGKPNYKCDIKIPKKSRRSIYDKIEQKEWKKLWGHKLDQLDKQTNNLTEKIRLASLSGDYSKLEPYITFPFKFSIEDYQGCTICNNRDYTQIYWIANNMAEFTEYFNTINKREEYTLKGLCEQGYPHTYWTTATIKLFGDEYKMYVDIIPNIQKSNIKPKYKFYALPEERSYFNNNNFKFKIKLFIAQFY